MNWASLAKVMGAETLGTFLLVLFGLAPSPRLSSRVPRWDCGRSPRFGASE